MAPPAPAHGSPATLDALAQLSFLVYGLLQRRAAERQLSIVQMRLLGVLRDRDPTINQLARLLDLDKSSVSGLVDRAERRGLVRRVPRSDDRRSVQVTLSEAGRALATEVAAQFATDVERVLAPLPATDRRALTRLISRALVADAGARGIDLFAPADATA